MPSDLGLHRLEKGLLTLFHTMTEFDASRKKPSENIERKGENVDNHIFVFFQQYIYPLHHFSQNEIVVCKCFQFGKV